MNLVKYSFLILLLNCLVACSSGEDSGAADEPAVEAPDSYTDGWLSELPDREWYVSDFFRSATRWDPESTINLDDLELGMYELTQYPDQDPLQVHREIQDKLVADSIEIAERNGWFDYETGLSDGFEKMFGDPVHYVNIDYVFDGETMNLEKPEVLMYYRTRDGIHLMGIMFLAVGERGPQIAGPLSKWHYHIDRGMCYEQDVLPIGRTNEDGSCEVGVYNQQSSEMLHVWFFEHPEGMFATRMGLNEEMLNFGINQINEIRNATP